LIEVPEQARTQRDRPAKFSEKRMMRGINFNNLVSATKSERELETIKQGDIKWLDENSAEGRLSGIRFQYSKSGYGNDAIHKITAKFHGSVRHQRKFLNESQLIIMGEWEFSEFKSFVASLGMSAKNELH